MAELSDPFSDSTTEPVMGRANDYGGRSAPPTLEGNHDDINCSNFHPLTMAPISMMGTHHPHMDSNVHSVTRPVVIPTSNLCTHGNSLPINTKMNHLNINNSGSMKPASNLNVFDKAITV